MSTIGVKFKMAEDDANLGDELLDTLTGFDEHLETVESLNSGNERRAEEIKSRNISHFIEDIIQNHYVLDVGLLESEIDLALLYQMT